MLSTALEPSAPGLSVSVTSRLVTVLRVLYSAKLVIHEHRTSLETINWSVDATVHSQQWPDQMVDVSTQR